MAATHLEELYMAQNKIFNTICTLMENKMK